MPKRTNLYTASLVHYCPCHHRHWENFSQHIRLSGIFCCWPFHCQVTTLGLVVHQAV